MSFVTFNVLMWKMVNDPHVHASLSCSCSEMQKHRCSPPCTITSGKPYTLLETPYFSVSPSHFYFSLTSLDIFVFILYFYTIFPSSFAISSACYCHMCPLKAMSTANSEIIHKKRSFCPVLAKMIIKLYLYLFILSTL